MANQDVCYAQGRGYDPTTGLCVMAQTPSTGTPAYDYYMPGQAARTVPPIPLSDPAKFSWPPNASLPSTGWTPPIPQPIASDFPTPAPALGFFDGIVSFLQTPGPLGIPYGLIGAGVVVALIVMAESGTGKKKGGGWI